MGETTKIEWTDHTFNPWIGCTKVHAGCKSCYAEISPAAKFKGIQWGEGAPRHVTGEDNWKKPLAWARAAAKGGGRRRVFCASLADVLDEEAPPEAQARLWTLIRDTAYVCPLCIGREDPGECSHIGDPGGLDWLLLTKRPERWRLVPEDVRPLVWLGTSISDQATADEWVPRLLAAEGFRLRFLSVEPMIGPVNLTRIPGENGVGLHAYDVLRGRNIHHDDGEQWIDAPRVDWVICGGESGSGARPFDTAWGRSLRDQCRDAGVPFFWKQMGALPTVSYYDDLREEYEPRGLPWVPLDWNLRDGQPPLDTRVRLPLNDKKGGDMAEWPEDLRVREFPEASR